MVIHDGENGILVPVGDEHELAVAMTRVADENELAYRLGKNAAGVRELLSANAIADMWSEVIGGECR